MAPPLPPAALEHRKDLDLLNNIKEYLGCAGCAAIRSNNNGADFVISSNSQIINILLFFTKYPLIGDKNLSDFVKAADIIKNKRHLTC